MRPTILTTTGLAAAGAVLALIAPASADSVGVTDPRDLDHGVDLRSVQVAHGTTNLVITTTHKNLRPSFRSGSSGSVFIDTDASDPGPEFAFVGGYFAGTDYQLVRTEGFHHRTWGMPVRGSYRMTLDYTREHVRMRISRKALGSPEQVRVAVKVAGSRRDGSNTSRDWLGERRSFTEWVAAEQG